MSRTNSSTITRGWGSGKAAWIGQRSRRTCQERSLLQANFVKHLRNFESIDFRWQIAGTSYGIFGRGSLSHFITVQKS